jgi:hypothetical protein
MFATRILVDMAVESCHVSIYIFFYKHSTNVDTYTYMITHTYKHTYRPYPCKHIWKTEQVDFEIYEFTIIKCVSNIVYYWKNN